MAGCRLFRGADPSFVASLARQARITRLHHGERLWRRGEDARHFNVVLSGVLELQRSPAGGEATLLALFGPGETPGVPVALERGTYIADAYAATGELEVLRVCAEPILEALPTSPALSKAMNRALLEHCRLLHAKIDVLAAGSVRTRLAAFLLDLADRFGDQHHDGLVRVPVSLSRQQLAMYIDARVETVIRCCSGWRKSGLVTTADDGFVISSLDALRRVHDGTDGEEIPLRRAVA